MSRHTFAKVNLKKMNLIATNYAKCHNDTDVSTTQRVLSSQKTSSYLKDRATVASLSVAFGQTLFTLISFWLKISQENWLIDCLIENWVKHIYQTKLLKKKHCKHLADIKKKYNSVSWKSNSMSDKVFLFFTKTCKIWPISITAQGEKTCA